VAALAGAECGDNRHEVVGRGVEPLAAGVRAGDAVLLAADHAAFDLEDDAER
jgi:hypothetical protein